MIIGDLPAVAKSACIGASEGCFQQGHFIMKNIKISALFLLMGSFALNAQSLKSPDGKFEMNFQLKAGVPFYNLKYHVH